MVFTRKGGGQWWFVLRIPALGRRKQEDPGVPGQPEMQREEHLLKQANSKHTDP